MNKFKIMFAVVIAMIVAVMSSPAVADLDDDPNDPRIVAGKKAIVVYQGDDFGKIAADRNTFRARDRECDGRSVYARVIPGPAYEDPFAGKMVWDENGCTDGGGYTSLPNWARRISVCEIGGSPGEVYCSSYSPLSEW